MRLSDLFLAEFSQEAKTTRRLLERVPDGQGEWKPHEKSMTLARLAGHVAEIAGWAEQVVELDVLDFSRDEFEPFAPGSTEELLAGFDRRVESFENALRDVSDEHLAKDWTMRSGDQVFLAMPRVAALRGFVMGHLIHHRGQLTVYLRLLDVPLPSIYGPSADEPGF